MELEEMDLTAILDGLESPSFQQRKDSLELLRAEISVLVGPLEPGAEKGRLLRTVAALLSDSNWNISMQCLNFLIEVLPHMKPDLIVDVQATNLPTIVHLLGDNKVAIRKVASEALQALFQRSPEAREVVAAVVQNGLRSTDARVRLESTMQLPAIISCLHKGAVVSGFDYKDVVVPLVDLLSDRVDSVVKAAIEALARLKPLIGDGFPAIIKRLNGTQKEAYQIYMSQIVNTGMGIAGGPQIGAYGAVSTSEAFNSPPQPAAGRVSAFAAPPPKPGDGAVVGLEVSAKPLLARGGSNSNLNSAASISFGFVPNRLLAELSNRDEWRIRASAILELQQLVRSQQSFQSFETHVPKFIDFLNGLLQDTNFKIELTTLEILGDLIEKPGLGFKSIENTVMPLLIQKLGDNKIVVRQANMRVILRMMHTVSPQYIISQLLGALDDKNWRVREEIVGVLVLALLTFTSNEFDFGLLTSALYGCLLDSKAKVKLMAIECFAVIHSLIGSRLFLFSSNLDEKTTKLLRDRFSAHDFPFVNPDGVVEYPYLSRSSAEEALSQLSQQGDEIYRKVPSAGRSATQRIPFLSGAAGANAKERTVQNEFEKPDNGFEPPKRLSLYPMTIPDSSNPSPASDISTPTSHSSFTPTMFLSDFKVPAKVSRLPSHVTFAVDVCGGEVDSSPSSSNTTPSSRPIWLGEQIGNFSGTAAHNDNEVRHPVAARQGRRGSLKGQLEESSGDDTPVMQLGGQGGAFVGRAHAGRRAQLHGEDHDDSHRDPFESPLFKSSPAWLTGNRGENLSSYSPSQQLYQSVPVNPAAIADKLKVLKAKTRLDKHSRVMSASAALEASAATDVSMKVNMDPRAGTAQEFRRNSGETTNPFEVGAPELDPFRPIKDSTAAINSPIPAVPRVRFAAKSVVNLVVDSNLTPSSNLSPSSASPDYLTPPVNKKKSAVQMSATPAELSPLDLLPFPDRPDRDLMVGLEKLQSGDWIKQLEGLDMVRAVSLHCPQFFTTTAQLHSIVRLVLTVVENLRSGLSRAALVTVGDMFNLLKTSLDANADQICLVLIKKAAENAQGFIADEAKRALNAMIDNVTDTRALTAILNCDKLKAAPQRARVAIYLDRIVEIMGAKLRSIAAQLSERLLALISALLNEGASETRALAKRAAVNVHAVMKEGGDFDRTLRKLSDADSARLRECIEKHIRTANKGMGAGYTLQGRAAGGVGGNFDNFSVDSSGMSVASGPITSALTGSRIKKSLPAGARTSRAATSGNMEGISVVGASSIGGGGGGAVGGVAGVGGGLSKSDAMEPLAQIFTSLASTDFRVRCEGVAELGSFMLSTDKIIVSSKIGPIAENISNLCMDNNAKVSMASMQALQKVFPSYKEDLNNFSAMLIPAVAQAIASTNSSVKNLAQEVFADIVKHGDALSLVQPLASVTEFGSVKSKPFALDRLREVVRPAHTRRPLLITKHVLPLAFRLLDERKAEMKVPSHALVVELHEVMGPALLAAAQKSSDLTLAKVRDVISSS